MSTFQTCLLASTLPPHEIFTSSSQNEFRTTRARMHNELAKPPKQAERPNKVPQKGSPYFTKFDTKTRVIDNQCK